LDFSFRYAFRSIQPSPSSSPLTASLFLARAVDGLAIVLDKTPPFSLPLKMAYTRHSSQPATVDLVRADLAEFWTIDESEADIPKKPPSVSGISDMLDLEYIPTPRPGPSKTMRKDPLPDILGDFLELSPTRKGERNDAHGKQATKSSGTRNEQSRNQDSTTAGRLSTPVNHASSSSGPDNPADAGQKQGHSPPLEPLPQHASKRKRHNQPTKTADSPVDPPVPKPRRQRQSNVKSVASSTAGKGPVKTSKNANVLLPGTANPAPARSKPKARKQGDDLFELSDVTDTEGESRPKKRQAKQTSSKKPSAPPARTAQAAERKRNAPAGQGRGITRVAKKPTAHVAPPSERVELETLKSNTVAAGNEGAGSDTGSNQVDDKNTSPLHKLDPAGQIRMDQQAPITRTASTSQVKFSDSRTSSPATPREAEPVLPVVANSLKVISLSSGSPDANNGAAGLTSPMFVEQHQVQAVAGPSPDIAITGSSEMRPNEVSPTRQSAARERLTFTPPPSFQPRALGNSTDIPRNLNTYRPLPADIREAFFSDERPAASPLPAREPEPCPGEESPRPEDIWSQAVDHDSPPAILHRIVTVSASPLWLSVIIGRG
jgi:hypothetical protein